MSSRRVLIPVCALLLGGLVVAGPMSQAVAPVSEHLKRPLVGGEGSTFPGAEVAVGDADRRGPRLAPLATATRHLAGMGKGMQVSWTQYGTPLSLTREGGYLATGLSGTPAQVARAYLKANSALWGLTPADVDALQLSMNEPLSQSSAYSVSFQQLVDGISLVEGGYAVVGVKGGDVAIVTGSLVPASLLRGAHPARPRMSVQKAVLAAAEDAGVTGLRLADLRVGSKVDQAGFTHVTTSKLHQPQRARVRVLPTTDRGARLVWEVDVLDVAGGRALATMSYVDAETGEVLLRRDAVDTLAQGTAGVPAARSVSLQAPAGLQAPIGPPGTFEGTYSKTACSAKSKLVTAPGDRTLLIAAMTNAANLNDIVIKVHRNGVEVATIDILFQPEAGVVEFFQPLKATDVVTAQVCPFTSDVDPPFGFTGVYTLSDQSRPPVLLPGPVQDGKRFGPATWRGFESNPELPLPGRQSKDDRYLACSGAPRAENPLMKALARCQYLFSDGSPLAYDVEPVLGLPTFTTSGNNAITSNAQLSSSLTPGAPFLPPVSPTRDYAGTFDDVWSTSRCDPASILPPKQANIDAAVVNLFLGHNRVHDFAYSLGLTETRGALQVSNFGKTGPGVAEGDPEMGNAQNAALTHNAFPVTNQVTGRPPARVQVIGRNNANQITLQDGVPGITNQYLWQPVVGFHGPCADGNFDGAVFIHEYTHAISNRLVGGPDTTLGTGQSRSMGESWSDQVALEYLNAFGLAGSRGEHPYSMGAYVTGDRFRGIRNHNLAPENNPLNYSNVGYDPTHVDGAHAVHPDGEIWTAAMFDVRKALIAKYNKAYPYGNASLQRACATGRYPSGAKGPSWNKCPGNRRYVTYLFDAMILMGNGSPSMVDMRNATLAAVLMRDKRDYATVADALAGRGLGAGASSRTNDDSDPVPSFASPTAAKNGKLGFRLVDASTGRSVKGSVFVGSYHARSTPVATTLGTKDQPDATALMMRGRYPLTVQARGYGIQRFTVDVKPGATTKVLRLQQNVASGAYGTSVRGNAGALRLGQVLDDSELTNGAFDGQPVAGRTITVGLGRGTATIDRVAVSALHHVPKKLGEGSLEIQSRLIGIRAFDIQVSSNGGRSFTTVYRSPSSFFPADRPRAVAPDLILRTVKLPRPVKANVVRLVIRSNACTGGSDFNRELENDPLSRSDCRVGVPATPDGTYPEIKPTTQVTVTELQVFRKAGS